MLLAASLASAMQMPFVTDLLEGFSPAPDIQDEGIVVRIRDTDRDSMKIVQGQINAPVPPSVMWSVITDYEAYPQIFDRYRKMEILEKSGTWELHRSEVDYPIFGSRWVANVLHHEKPSWRIRFQRADGTIKQVEGVWALKETAPGRTTMRYAVRLDPGLPFVPSWVVTWGTQTMMPSILRSVANEAIKRNRPTAKAS
ncbi:MAG: SRPBCC family protein [Candidatus Sericytochromatia bacterium]|nr:SRPBCC family protein [Candidatus Tanganyikabacteria bacterium]